MISCEPHCLHHGFGAGHMERNFVQSRELGQALDVVRDDRVVRAQHGAKLANAGKTALHRPFVAVIAQEIDAVRSAEIVEGVAVEIDKRHAVGRSHEGTDLEMLAHQAAVLERHPVGLGERKVGDRVDDLRGMPGSFCKARGVKRRKAHEGIPAERGDFGGRIVGAEESAFVVFVERHQRGYSARDSCVTAERGVFRLGQLQPALQRHQRSRDHAGAKPVKCQCGAAYVHHAGA